MGPNSVGAWCMMHGVLCLPPGIDGLMQLQGVCQRSRRHEPSRLITLLSCHSTHITTSPALNLLASPYPHIDTAFLDVG
jgi:hypothetical protein